MNKLNYAVYPLAEDNSKFVCIDAKSITIVNANRHFEYLLQKQL